MTTDSRHPREVICIGAKILQEVLEPCGFMFSPGDEGKGSGGIFASGKFVKEDRVLQFSFRYGMGEVTYQIQKKTISHENYLKYSGNWQQRKYPDFGSTPEQSFSALAHDIEEFFNDFVSGSGEECKGVVAAYESDPAKFKGFTALARCDA
jgi:hypothetical protein